MSTPVDPDFRARLAALNEKFAATVPGTLDKIRTALVACQAGGAQPPQDALHELHEVLHGVAGSAGTFGFAVFGQESRRVEQMVRAVLATQTGWEAVVPEVEKLLVWAARDPKANQYD
ncbi:Hpt domain-containing protein [Duganella sp. FT80W]|uniref:Hpt domain-containing protein n=1 Tax=Duganella guangzhouensis TaxID=2666084 RepID=A0A6I2L7D0_9BURK|nr:Hpt domain-containing protein [Duganella guangzhouensis]MRW94145.1 Hpt domain-containing protein [Duganella guangzhouensis]